MESIETGWSKWLKGVSIELHFVKNDLRFWSGEMFASLEKRKLWKSKFMRNISEFDWSFNYGFI